MCRKLTIYLLVISVLALGTGKMKAWAEKNKIELSEDNPFLTWSEQERLEDEDERVLKNLILTAVLYSGDTSRAVINGKILKKGDLIDNKEVAEIKPEKVILKDLRGKEYVVKMKKILDSLNFQDDSQQNSSDEYRK